MIPVRTTDRRYAAAVAELAPRARPDEGASGAVVVVAGAPGWWREAARAADAGARAVVVDEPAPAPDEALAALSERGVPTALVRRRLRPDHIVDARTPRVVRLVVADAAGPGGALAEWSRDVAGWARVLAGGPIALSQVKRTPGAVLAAGRAASGVPVSLLLALDRGSASSASVVAIAEERAEVRWDEAAAEVEIATADERGRRVAVSRREAAERLALRRVLDALADGEQLADLAHLRADERVGRRLAAAFAS